MGIVTYCREDTLPTTLRLAALQSRPPAELLVVDAGPDPQRIEQLCRVELDAAGAAVPLRYLAYPHRPSIPAQRNYLLEHATTDVVFFFDDDSFMHPQCAERIMRVYEADRDKQVLAVAAKPTQINPCESAAAAGDVPAEATGGSSPVGVHRDWTVRVRKFVRWPLGQLRRWLRGILNPHNMFVPYDGEFPKMALPESVTRLDVRPLPLMEGFTMTVRTEAASACGYEARMVRGGEDLDFSYRLSRRGSIGRAYTAHVFHAQSARGRSSLFVASALESINPLFCHRLHSSDQRRSLRRLRMTYTRRVLLEAIDDLAASRWSIPRARGFLVGMREMRRILALPDGEVEE